MAGIAWTNDELIYLKVHFNDMSCEDIGLLLGRSTRSVQHKFGELGLERKQPEVGDTINRLTIKSKFTKPVGKQNKTFVMVTCSCNPDKEFSVLLSSIVQGTTKSCKCLQSEIQRERAIERNYKHGQSQNPDNHLYKKWVRMKYNSGIEVCPEWQEYVDFEKWSLENGYEDGYHIYRLDEDMSYVPNNCMWHEKGFCQDRLYQTWVDMIQRCENPNCESYKNYGERGILICKDWRSRYFNFKKWASSSGYNDTLTIERKDVDGEYGPNNCKWIPLEEQASNRRNNHYINAFGELKHAYNWSKDFRCKVNSSTIIYRISKGWQPEIAITTPPYVKPLDLLLS